LFNFADLDKDGKLDLTEVAKVLLNAFPNMTESEIEPIFHQADKNKDGKIDFNEWADIIRESRSVSSTRSPHKLKDAAVKLPALRTGNNSHLVPKPPTTARSGGHKSPGRAFSRAARWAGC